MSQTRAARFSRIFVSACLGGVLLAGGCQSSKKDDGRNGVLTPGTVKMSVVPGETTQTQILESFGPPDLVTHKDGVDVWTYDKTTYDFETHGSYFTVLLAGASETSGSGSSRSTMLILYFDAKDVVSDYRLSSVKY